MNIPAESQAAEPPAAVLTAAVPMAAEPLPPCDADLIMASRSGDTTAYATLYRRHVAAAHGLARQLVRGRAEADDVVAETFAKVLDLLRRGGGPDGAFRPYLLTAVRRAAYDRHRAERRQVVTDKMEAFDPGVPFADPAVAGLERSMIARAFASLPERWQTVLWHTEIEGARPAEVAALLGLTANGVAALAYRAREGLRQAYLQMHLSGVARTECRPVAARLGAYVRGGLAKRDSAEVAAHLDQCADCRAVLAELGDVNVALRSIVAPLVLGPAAAGYLASAAAKGPAGGWAAGRLAWFRHAPKGQQAAAAGVAVAAVAGLATMAMALTAHTSPMAGGAPAYPPLPPAAAGAPPASVPPASAASRASGPSVGRTSGYGCGILHERVCRMPHPYVPSPSQPSAASHQTGAVSHQPSAPATSGPSSSVAAPGLAPAQHAQLTTQVDPVGTLPRGATGIVSFTVTDPGSVAALRVKADVTLPAGVSYLAAGARAMDSAAAAAPGGWACHPVPSGATCTHGPLAAGTSTTSYLLVAVAADAPAGTPPAISVGDGSRLVRARGTAGVSAGGFPAQFAASGRYTVVTAGASLAGRAMDGTGGRCESGKATWSPARLFSRPRCPAGAAGATLALPGRLVWAGLYWAWAARR
jgi:RNA polymerase sigma factor (sigma-70 family)